jgi:hypothetical protein
LGLANKITNPLASLERVYFPVTDSFYDFGQFSDLASENTKLLASLTSVLKNLFTPLLEGKKLSEYSG